MISITVNAMYDQGSRITTINVHHIVRYWEGDDGTKCGVELTTGSMITVAHSETALAMMIRQAMARARD